MYIHHYLGDWIRDNADTAATREPSAITYWETLEGMDPVTRAAFEWMQQEGLAVTTSGAHVYQIRRARG